MKNEKQKKVLIRLPADVASIVETIAHQRVRSFTNQTIVLIKMGLVNEKEEAKALSDADTLIAQLSANGT